MTDTENTLNWSFLRWNSEILDLKFQSFGCKVKSALLTLPTQSVFEVLPRILSGSPTMLHMINTYANMLPTRETHACGPKKYRLAQLAWPLTHVCQWPLSLRGPNICPCKLPSGAAAHWRLIVSVKASTFWPQLYVKEVRLQVGYLTTVMDQTATVLAHWCSTMFSLTHYYFCAEPRRLRTWNICIYLLRLERFQ